MGDARKDLRCASGMLWPSGPGTSRWTTARSAGTTSWTCASSVRLIKPVQQVRSVLWLGECATTLSIFTASLDGSRQEMFVHSATETGSSKNTAVKKKKYGASDFHVI